VSILQWLAPSPLVNLALFAITAEALAFIIMARRGVAIPSPPGLAANLAAGACLLLALRITASGPFSAAFLAVFAVALAAHVIDVYLRWPRSD
jgi:hypothetical protein